MTLFSPSHSPERVPAVEAEPRRIELLNLKLSNWRGMPDFELRLDGESAAIYGANGSGKTSIIDAAQWLLFGVDSLGRKEFDIKTLDKGEPVSGLQHEVEATFLVDGRQLKLRKAYYERHVQKRGSAEREFSGHTTDHFVDDIPVKEGEYNSRLAEVAPLDVWRLVSDPRAFQALHWRERRALLLDICGDLSDAEVIASNRELAELPEILDGRKLEDFKALAKASQTRINGELKLIPVRIDEADRALPEVDESDVPHLLEKGLETARSERAGITEQLAEAKAGADGAVAEKKRLREVQDALTDLERAAVRAVEDAQAAARSKLEAAKDELHAKQAEARRATSRLGEVAPEVARLGERIEERRAAYREVSVRKVEAHTPDTCPACQQALPRDRVDAAHQAALEQLNAAKSRELRQIEEEAAGLKARMATLETEAASLRSTIDALEREVANLEGKVKHHEQALAAVPTSPAKDPASTPEYGRLAAERDELTRKIEAIRAGADAGRVDAITAELTRSERHIADLEATLARARAHAAGTQRIQELKARERTLAAEYEELERHLRLCELFTVTKASLLTDRINSKFEVVGFKLFDQQVNGTIVDVCVTTIDGVPFDSANGAGRVQGGLDIVRALQAHFGLIGPVWLDERESVHQIPDMPGQVISMYHSPADRQLRVERSAA